MNWEFEVWIHFQRYTHYYLLGLILVIIFLMTAFQRDKENSEKGRIELSTEFEDLRQYLVKLGKRVEVIEEWLTLPENIPSTLELEDEPIKVQAVAVDASDIKRFPSIDSETDLDL